MVCTQDLDEEDEPEEVAADFDDEEDDEGEEADEEADGFYHPLSEMPEALADVSVGHFIVSHALADSELELGAITGARRQAASATFSQQHRLAASRRSCRQFLSASCAHGGV